MARRTVLAVPMPADLDDLLQVLTDVGQGWAGAKVELGPVTVDGDTLLILTASRRRAQRPAPGEEIDEDPDLSHARDGEPVRAWQEFYAVPPGVAAGVAAIEAHVGISTGSPAQDVPPVDPGAWLDAAEAVTA
jgi:hypothetical protein